MGDKFNEPLSIRTDGPPATASEINKNADRMIAEAKARGDDETAAFAEKLRHELLAEMGDQ